MTFRLFDADSSLLDAGSFLTNKTAILSFVFLFFLAVYLVNAIFRTNMPRHKVAATLKLAVFGFVLALLEKWVGAASPHADLIGNVQSIVAMLCLANLVTYVVVEIYIHYRMHRHVPSFLRDLVTMLVYVVFALVSLRVIFRIELSSILTATTVLTAAVAFAMQTTIANILSGFYVQNDENMKRGTWISLKENGVVGEIVNVGFRYTTLRTLDKQQVMVPNHQIMQNVVTSLGSRDGEKTGFHLRVGLGFDVPPEKAVKMLTRLLEEEEHVLKNPRPTVIVNGYMESSVEYDMKYYLDDYSRSRSTKGNLLSRIWYAVEREGYAFPYPHREVIRKTPSRPFERDAEAILAILKRTDLFSSLDDEEFRRLAGRTRVKVYGAGEVVVRQDEEGDSLFIVKRGSVNVRIDGALVGSLGAGEIFGEMSLLTGERRKATVVADGEVRMVEISKGDIEPLIKADPKLLDGLSAILAEREGRNIEHRKAMDSSRVNGGVKEAFLNRLKAFFGT